MQSPLENIHSHNAQAQHAQKMFPNNNISYNRKAHCNDTHGHNMRSVLFLHLLITILKPTVTASTAAMLCHNTCGNVAYSSNNIIYSIAFTAGILSIAAVMYV